MVDYRISTITKGVKKEVENFVSENQALKALPLIEKTLNTTGDIYDDIVIERINSSVVYCKNGSVALTVKKPKKAKKTVKKSESSPDIINSQTSDE